jgi:hypothetical protein
VPPKFYFRFSASTLITVCVCIWATTTFFVSFDINYDEGGALKIRGGEVWDVIPTIVNKVGPSRLNRGFSGSRIWGIRPTQYFTYPLVVLFESGGGFLDLILARGSCNRRTLGVEAVDAV